MQRFYFKGAYRARSDADKTQCDLCLQGGGGRERVRPRGVKEERIAEWRFVLMVSALLLSAWCMRLRCGSRWSERRVVQATTTGHLGHDAFGGADARGARVGARVRETWDWDARAGTRLRSVAAAHTDQCRCRPDSSAHL